MTATTSTRARSLLLFALALAWQTEALGRTRGRGRRLVGGAIAGIVIGCIVAVVIAIVLLWFCCRLFRRRRSGRVAVGPAQTVPQPAFAASPAGHADYAAPPGPPPATYQQNQQPFVGGFRPGGKTTV